jgi:o-succinylbenzoate---CoA ligase
MEGPFDLAPGELLVVDVPPGPTWVRLVHQLWNDRVSFMPLDQRLSARERRVLVDLARPTAVLDETGSLTVFAGAEPVDEEVALVMPTSGAGGTPRLVEHSREAVTSAVTASRDALAAAGHDVSAPLVCCLSPAHVGGMLVLVRGEHGDLRVVAHERFDPERLMREAPPGAGVSLVPTMLRRLVRARAELARLGTLLVGGAALDADLRAGAEALGARLVSTYGLTESCGGVVYDGVPLPGTQMRTDPDVTGGSPAPIELRGPTLMRGYRGDPAATGAAFDVRGWLRTGDAGTIGEDGRLVVRGRLDDAIRTGGETVWPDEVERALVDHPKVDEVAVAARPHRTWGQQVVAFVVPRRVDEPPTLEELREHATRTIARHKGPRELVLLPELPRTPSGKIRRVALPG